MARPTEYTEEIGCLICEKLSEGTPLTKVCKEEGLPSQSSVYRWLPLHEDFRLRYQAARADQAHAWFAEMIEIADDASGDFIEDKDGKTLVDHENINRARLRVDARKFAVSRLLPSVYGEKLGIGAAEGLAPLPGQMSNFEVARRVAFILSRADHELREQAPPTLQLVAPPTKERETELVARGFFPTRPEAHP